MAIKIPNDAKLKFTENLEAYLAGKLTHDQISAIAWDINDSLSDNPLKEDALYRSTIFAVIHLADECHWNDGITEGDLKPLAWELRDEIDKKAPYWAA